MAKKQEVRERIPVADLEIGLFVDLEMGWSEHPFLFSQFLIKTKKDITAIKRLGIKSITIIPSKCKVDLPKIEESDAEEDEESAEALWDEKKKHVDQAREYREKRRDVARRFHEQAKKVRKLTSQMKSEPANAIFNADEVVEDIVSQFDTEGDLVTNLINLGSGEHNTYNHSVNVTMLSLLLGSVEELNVEEMRQLAMGALLHDIGMIEVPGSIVMKKTPLNRAERDILQRHTLHGKKLTERVRNLPKGCLDIIEHHHEFLDATGFPHQLAAPQLTKLTRIVAVANTYDNLCNPKDISKAVTPKTALAMMYTKYKDKLDRELVEHFIRNLGVYPPGTVVRLDDGSIGLVISVDPKNLLCPEVLLYNPDIPKEDALIVALAEQPELKVQDVLTPDQYPSRIYSYLGIEERIGYFVESATKR